MPLTKLLIPVEPETHHAVYITSLQGTQRPFPTLRGERSGNKTSGCLGSGSMLHAKRSTHSSVLGLYDLRASVLDSEGQLLQLLLREVGAGLGLSLGKSTNKKMSESRT